MLIEGGVWITPQVCTAQGNSVRTKRIGIKPAGKVRGEQHWKISMADVPIEDVNFILIVYHFAKPIWYGQNLTLTTWIANACRHHQERLGMDFAD